MPSPTEIQHSVEQASRLPSGLRTAKLATSATPLPRARVLWLLAFSTVLWLLVSGPVPVLGATTNPIPTLAELRTRCSNHVAAPRFTAAAWGVKVISLVTGKTLFEHDADKLLSPASNTKLFTVALGLDWLGKDYRVRTSLHANERPGPDGTLKGDLILLGRGDPGFRADLHSNDLLRALEPLVFALTNAGVRQVEGNLIADESFFAGPPYGSGWDWDDLQHYYGAPISALTLNANCVTLTARPGQRAGEPVRVEVAHPEAGVLLENHASTGPAGSPSTFSLLRLPQRGAAHALGQLPLDARPVVEELPVPEPARWFGGMFKQALARHGVRISGQVTPVNWLTRSVAPLDHARLVELGSVESAPLSQMAAWILKPSQNLYTDLLLAHVGALAQATNAARARLETSEDAGVRELNRFLRAASIAPGQVIFEEGSGLSRNNLVTAAALVRLLEYMDRHPAAATWREALPVAGVDGTLRNRMKGSLAEGNVRAKTGTLRWANSLSGYVTTAAGERLAFSFMLNRYQNPERNRSTREELDDLAVWLASLSARSGEN
jgi:D-alanyl-D-alanine carboxypeptidase/D-alanyl-D-alanine-endopeptidase (penicillin-binding protein 4)